MSRPADWEAREKLVARAARWRCECIEAGHGHGEERCRLRGDHVQPRGDRTDWQLPHLMYVCQPCARQLWPGRFPDATLEPRTEPLPLHMDDPLPTAPHGFRPLPETYARQLHELRTRQLVDT